MCRIMEEVKLEGFEQGREEGIAEERARARAAAKQKALSMFKKSGLSLEEIAEYTDLSLEEVKELAAAALH